MHLEKVLSTGVGCWLLADRAKGGCGWCDCVVGGVLGPSSFKCQVVMSPDPALKKRRSQAPISANITPHEGMSAVGEGGFWLQKNELLPTLH